MDKEIKRKGKRRKLKTIDYELYKTIENKFIREGIINKIPIDDGGENMDISITAMDYEKTKKEEENLKKYHLRRIEIDNHKRRWRLKFKEEFPNPTLPEKIERRKKQNKSLSLTKLKKLMAYAEKTGQNLLQYL